MRAVLYASEPHYLDHLAPIGQALGGLQAWVPSPRLQAMAQARVEQVSVVPRRGLPRPDRGPLYLVASFQDLRAVAPRPAVMVNHGAGQTYLGDPTVQPHPSYSGGPGRDNVVLNICPGWADADRCRAAQPDVPAAAVGCPKLDPWHRRRVVGESRTLAISFHWDNRLCPEARSAWPHYGEDALAALVDAGWHVLGHGHPRWWRHLARRYDRVPGVELVQDFADVLDRAQLYVVDNSSTAPEFASTSRPVLLLNAPWYRREVWHGGRFWRWTEWLPSCDGPDTLVACAESAWERRLSDGAIRGRTALVDATYAGTDGRAAARAAAAIMTACDEWM